MLFWSFIKHGETFALSFLALHVAHGFLSSAIQGPLSSTFPIENRNFPVTTKALKTHLERTKSQPFVKRISDFHLLLTLARFLDVNADIPALAACVRSETAVPEGYQLLIESIANSGV